VLNFGCSSQAGDDDHHHRYGTNPGTLFACEANSPTSAFPPGKQSLSALLAELSFFLQCLRHLSLESKTTKPKRRCLVLLLTNSPPECMSLDRKPSGAGTYILPSLSLKHTSRIVRTGSRMGDIGPPMIWLRDGSAHVPRSNVSQLQQSGTVGIEEA